MSIVKTFIAIIALAIFVAKKNIVPSDDMLFIGACILACGFIAHED